MSDLQCSQAQTLLADYMLLELAPQDAAALDHHLRECAACRMEAEAMFRHERHLTELAAGEINLESRISAALLGSVSETSRASEPVHRRVAPSLSASRRRFATLLVAACLLIAPTIFVSSPFSPQTAEQQAQFEKVEGDVFVVADDVKVRATPGLHLRPGQITSVGENGAAVIAFPDATRLMLGAVTTITWSPFSSLHEGGRNNVYLAEGAITAATHHDGQDTPMVVTTPQAEVLAGRGQFTLFQAGKATHVEAERGTVHVRRLKDNRAVAVPSGTYTTVLADGPAPQAQPMPQRINEPRTTLTVAGGVNALTFSTDGGTLVAGGPAGITLFDVAGVMPARKLECGKPVRIVAVSPDGKTVAAGADRHLAIWKLDDDNSEPARQHPVSTLFALRFVAGGTAILGCSYDRQVRRVDLESGKLSTAARLKNYRSDYDFPATMDFSPSNRMLAWGLKDNTTRLWDVATASEKQVLREHEGAVTALAFDAVEAMLATGSRDRTICLWELPEAKLRNTLHGHRHTINALAFSPDCRLLASASSDQTVKIWDVAFAREIATLRGHSAAVMAVAFSPDSKTLASGSADGTVKLWNVE